jgi:hypothetical protein
LISLLNGPRVSKRYRETVIRDSNRFMDLATLVESICLNISGPIIVGSGIQKVVLQYDLGLSYLTVYLSFLVPTDHTTVGDLGRLRTLWYS